MMLIYMTYCIVSGDFSRRTVSITLLGYIGAYTFEIAAYNSTMLELIRETYKHHRLEFKRHIKSMLVNFLATELSLIIIIAFSGYIYGFEFCLL